jgi:myo-inositol-1(or 4)-monophosphatase
VADAVAAHQPGAPPESADLLDELLVVARNAAAAGARTATSWARRRGELEVSEKAAADDLVSQADHDAEREIRAVLECRRPGDGVLGEEGGATEGSTGIDWIVDPIDGTTNYLYDRPDWAVSVAAVRAEDGQALAGVVLEPARDRATEARLGGGTWSAGQPVRRRPVALERAVVELNLGRGAQRELAGPMVAALFPRVRDLRRGGSAASALVQVADGRADAFWGPGLQAWDGAAGMLIVTEAGGQVGDLGGQSPAAWPASGDVLAAVPGLWEPLHAVLADTYPG